MWNLRTLPLWSESPKLEAQEAGGAHFSKLKVLSCGAEVSGALDASGDFKTVKCWLPKYHQCTCWYDNAEFIAYLCKGEPSPHKALPVFQGGKKGQNLLRNESMV